MKFWHSFRENTSYKGAFQDVVISYIGAQKAQDMPEEPKVKINSQRLFKFIYTI